MKKRALLFAVLLCFSVAMFAQIIPVRLSNNSEFPDNEVYIGIIGQNSSGAIYYNLANNSASHVDLPRLTTGCNTLHKVAGDRGYANVFFRLSDIANRTIYLDKTFACRMFFGFRSPMYMHVNDDNGGYAGANLQNSSDPNLNQRFEFVEFTYNDAGLWINTTRVDAFQYPMGLELYGRPTANVRYVKAGETISYTDIINRWKSASSGSVFANCLINNITSDNLGGIIMQPSKVESIKNQGYFDDYINRIWSAFSQKDMLADMGELGQWRGRVYGNSFQLTCINGTYQGQTATVNKPTTTDVIEGAGTFAQYISSDRDLPVQAMFCGAINRGVINTNLGSGVYQNWGEAANFFRIDTYNPYVKFFHQSDISFEGRTYAFAYDDTFGQSSTCYTNQPERIAIAIGGFLGGGGSGDSGASVGAAPQPGVGAENVKSIYSDAYGSVTPNMFVGSWGQSTTSSVVSLNGNNAYLNTNFNYLGWQFGDDNTYVDARDMEYLHLDVFPTSAFTINVYPISKNGDGTTNDQVKKSIGLTANKWNQIDIPLSELSGLDLSKIFQMKFDGGNGETFYLDNVYFYKNATIGGGDGQNNANYTLVWSDEFDSNTLGRNWNVEVNGDGGGNSELQYYTDRADNVKIENGNLVITAKRENYNGKNFTSGRINSRNKVAFKHGKIEASIKLPNLANGLWPAFWLMGDDGRGWPACGEIDILEMGEAGGIRSGKQNSWLGGTIHWGSDVNSHQYWSDLGQHDVGYNVAGDGNYHKYTMVWDDTFIRMYLDDSDTPYMTAAISKSINADITSDEYMHKPYYILFNMAVGGMFPQIYDAGGITALPYANSSESMYVDYVRIYQADNNVTFVENDANHAGNGETPATKKAKYGVGTFCQDINYGGYNIGLDEGAYTKSELQNYGIKDNDISSLKVMPGYKVIAYTEDNFGGASREFYGNVSWIGSDWNDVVSSLKIVPAGVTGKAGQWKIQNRNSGMFVDLDGNRTDNITAIVQWTDEGAEAYQQWKFVEEEPGVYSIRAFAADSRGFDCNATSGDNSTQIILYDYWGSHSQQFILADAGDGYYNLVARHCGRVVEMPGASTNPGEWLKLWDNNGSPCQQWRLVSPEVIVDLTNNGGVIDASHASVNANEAVEKAIDNTSSSKYCAFIGAGDNVWVRYASKKKAILRSYAITSANDAQGRDPRDWQLQGSNDGDNWTTLDTRSGETFANRFQTNTYAVNNTGEYSWYRLLVTGRNNSSSTVFQIAELELNGVVTGDAVINAPAAPMPQHNAATVKSVYSNSYASPALGVSPWATQWITTSQDGLERVSLNGNEAIHLNNFNFAAYDLSTAINASDMQYLHIDIFPVNIDNVTVHPNGDVNTWYNIGLVQGKWNSVDIPLSAFGGYNFSGFGSVKFTGTNGADADGHREFYLDNIYFFTTWANAKSLTVPMSIDHVATDEQNVDGPIYTIDGRQVQRGTKLHRGVYIINGKKVVVR